MIMINKKARLSLVYFTLVSLISCGGGGGGPAIVTTNTSIAPQASSTVNSVFTTPLPSPSPTYSEKITEEINVDPRVQFASYLKMLKALEKGEFEYLVKEYDAGGLKISAVKAENDFGDYPINFAISSLLTNNGTVGIKDNIVLAMSVEERKAKIDKLLKHIFIYSSRFMSNRLSELSKTTAAASNEKYAKTLSTNAGIYFYGSDNMSPVDFSIAKMSQKIDSENSTKTFDQIAGGLSQIQKALPNDYKTITDGKNMIEKGLLKMLYIAILDKAALAIPEKKSAELDDAEIYYLGMREHAKSRDNIKTTKIEQLLGARDFRTLDYSTFEKYLNAGFHEKAINEMQISINNIINNSLQAQISAVNAQLYIDMINSGYQNKKYKRVENTFLKDEMIKFIAAINSKNKDLAENSFINVQKLSAKLVS